MATTFVSLAAMAAMATGIWEGTALLDRLHVTESELALYDATPHAVAEEAHDDLGRKIDTNATVGKCRWLKSEIRALKDSIYTRTRDGADPDYIHDLEEDLHDLERSYTALGCARLLA